MRKLILGILAVVCVQFAFVIYTALQSPMELAVGPVKSDPQMALSGPEPSEPDAAEETVPEPAEPVPGDELEPTAPTPASIKPRRAVTPIRLEEPRFFRTRVEEPVRRSAEYFPAASESRTQSGVFETVVISYDRSAAISDCYVEEVPKPRKRSYIAKAAPVIKKPWEWIKSIGSKFN